jgi:hypothetical protein
LDASLEKRIKKVTLFLKSNNILNTPIKLYLKKYNSVNDLIMGYESIKNGTLLRNDINGINVQLGLKFKL